MTERYWVHSEPTGWNGAQATTKQEAVDEIPGGVTVTTDRGEERYAVHPDGRFWHLCPSRRHAKPTAAQPVWCEACQERIRKAIGRMPELAAQLYDLTGDRAEPPTTLRWIVADSPIVKRARVPGTDMVLDVTIGRRIVLGCRHILHLASRPETEMVECGACACEPQPQPGRLAAGAVDGDDTRRGTRTGSPSGSPAWDAVEQLVAWACRTEAALRERLDHAKVQRPWKQATVAGRAGCLTQSCDYLATWCSDLLSGGDAAKVGREVLRLERRAEQAAGLDRLSHHLPGPCPRCNKRGRLRRDDGEELVQCQACRATWDWDYYELLAKIYADAHGGKATG